METFREGPQQVTCVDPSAAMLEMATATLQRRSSRIEPGGLETLNKLHGFYIKFPNCYPLSLAPSALTERTTIRYGHYVPVSVEVGHRCSCTPSLDLAHLTLCWLTLLRHPSPPSPLRCHRLGRTTLFLQAIRCPSYRRGVCVRSCC
jgi:hypothetical protein